MEEKVKEIIILVLENANKNIPEKIQESSLLRNDLGLDSMMLAELTVHLEEEFGIDIFADGIVSKVGDIYTKLHV